MRPAASDRFAHLQSVKRPVARQHSPPDAEIDDVGISLRPPGKTTRIGQSTECADRVPRPHILGATVEYGIDGGAVDVLFAADERGIDGNAARRDVLHATGLKHSPTGGAAGDNVLDPERDGHAGDRRAGQHILGAAVEAIVRDDGARINILSAILREQCADRAAAGLDVLEAAALDLRLVRDTARFDALDAAVENLRAGRDGAVANILQPPAEATVPVAEPPLRRSG
jgi:hypothetical protein